MNFSNNWALSIIIRQSIVMIPLLGSQLQFYQKKSYKLEMEVITLQDELLSLKTSKGDEYKFKYEMLLDRIAEQNQLKQSKRNESLLQQEKTINEINQKWEQILNQKISDFNIQLESLTLEKSSLKNKAIELELKCIKLQKVIDDGDSQVLAIKLESIKKDNERLRKDNDQLYRSRLQAVDKIERQSELKIQTVKEREKSFYREQIEALEQRIEQTEVILQSQRQKISPEREKLITSLQAEIQSLKLQHDEELQKVTAVIQKKNKQIKSSQEERELLDKSNFDLLNDMNNQLKNLEEKLFRFEQEKIMEIKAIQSEMSRIRQKEADDLKKQFQKMKNEFDQERQQWKRIAEQSKDTGNTKQKDYEEQKQRFLQQKNRLKTKITELKIRLKERQEQKGNGQTQLLIKSLRQMNNNEAHFNNYEDAITFMDRQVRKASLKIEQKNREISNLLQQLKTLQTETQIQVKDVKQKSKNQQKKLYDKLFVLQEEIDELQQKLREKEKYIRKKQSDLDQQKEGHQIEVQNLKKIIEQMERDYKRLTGNKKGIEDSYRQERQNVISGKLDVNQQRKKKWMDLIRQRNELEIVYREREMQIKADHQVQIDKLKRQKQRLIQQREEYKADAELLRERLNQSSQDNKENRMVDYQKKLATLDLQIALTQNLFSTLSNATSKKGQNIRVQLQQLSEDRSSKVGSSHSFQLKASNMTPLFIEGEIPKQDLFKTGGFSFSPYNLKK